MLDHFLEMSSDKVISVKILFVEVVTKLKQICIYDDQVFNSVYTSVSVLLEDQSAELRSQAEVLSYDLLMWKKEKLSEEFKESVKEKEDYEVRQRDKEKKEEEKRKKQEEEEQKNLYIPKETKKR